MTIGVIVILASVLFKGVQYWKERAEGVRCAENLRSLHASLASYVSDAGHWPQEPQELWNTDGDAYEDWWIAEMKPYGASEAVWLCPTVFRRISSKNPKQRPKLHYTPTMFDDKPSTPFKWKGQPWLVEIGNMHGRGALMSFPDGSIKSQDDVDKGW